MPPDDQALEFFLAILSKKSRPESDAADLAILNLVLKASKSKATKIWPILDIHMSRTDPNIREVCLRIARRVFNRRNNNIGDLKSIMNHIDLIIDDTKRDKYKVCRFILTNVVELLCSIPCFDEPTKSQIQPRLIEILKALPSERLNAGDKSYQQHS